MSPYLQVKEAAQYLRIGKSTMYSLKNRIPHRDHAGRVIFHKDDLDAYSASQVRLPKPALLSRFQSARARVRSLKTEVITHPTPQKGVG
jgi:excisionase family DNA binding protein